MPGINQSGDRSPYFSWRNSVFEFLSRPGRIQANAKYSPGKKGYLHSAYIRGKSIRRMPPSPPQSRTETRVLGEFYVNCDILTTVHFSLFEDKRLFDGKYIGELSKRRKDSVQRKL